MNRPRALLRAVSVVVCCLMTSSTVRGHGRLIDPPARSTMWRYGWSTPVDYADNQLFCGGFQRQWTTNGGLCGVCGDPYDGARDHEMGGRYAAGVVSRHYGTGEVIDVTIEVTANHRGWMQLRVCADDTLANPAVQACLDQHVLPLADGSGTKFAVLSGVTGAVVITVRLPPNLTCLKCVLQWKYHAGNSWGVDPDTNRGCVGCGPQEEFYGCADIRISDGGGGDVVSPTTTAAPTTTTGTTTTKSAASSSDQPCSVYGATELYAAVANLDDWCQVQCDAGYCPQTHCRCLD